MPYLIHSCQYLICQLYALWDMRKREERWGQECCTLLGVKNQINSLATFGIKICVQTDERYRKKSRNCRIFNEHAYKDVPSHGAPGEGKKSDTGNEVAVSLV